MITKEEYETSLIVLAKKEKKHKEALLNGISFMNIYNESLDISKKENKLIFILFHVTGCDGCNVTEYTIDHSEKIQNYLSKYIVLKYNSSDIKTNLTNKYNIYTYPTIVIINNEEKIIRQKLGCQVLDGGPENHILNWLTSSKK